MIAFYISEIKNQLGNFESKPFKEINKGDVVEFHHHLCSYRIVSHMGKLDIDFKASDFNHWFDVDLCFEMVTGTRIISKKFEDQLEKLEVVYHGLGVLKEKELIKLGRSRLFDS